MKAKEYFKSNGYSRKTKAEDVFILAEEYAEITSREVLKKFIGKLITKLPMNEKTLTKMRSRIRESINRLKTD